MPLFKFTLIISIVCMSLYGLCAGGDPTDPTDPAHPGRRIPSPTPRPTAPNRGDLGALENDLFSDLLNALRVGASAPFNPAAPAQHPEASPFLQHTCPLHPNGCPAVAMMFMAQTQDGRLIPVGTMIRVPSSLFGGRPAAGAPRPTRERGEEEEMQDNNPSTRTDSEGEGEEDGTDRSSN